MKVELELELELELEVEVEVEVEVDETWMMIWMMIRMMEKTTLLRLVLNKEEIRFLRWTEEWTLVEMLSIHRRNLFERHTTSRVAVTITTLTKLAKEEQVDALLVIFFANQDVRYHNDGVGRRSHQTTCFFFFRVCFYYLFLYFMFFFFSVPCSFFFCFFLLFFFLFSFLVFLLHGKL